MAKLRRILIALAVLSLIAAGHSRSKSLHHVSWSNSMEEESNDIDYVPRVCSTEECHQIARAFANTMNRTVDPCDNFYEFVCGGWKAKNPIPKDAPVWSEMMQFQAILESRIKEELEIESSSKDILPVRQARKWYHSCMNTKNREARGINPIESLLMQTGGWPMVMDVEEWNEDVTWQEIEEYYARLTGENIFHRTEMHRLLLPIFPKPVKIILLKRPEIPLEGALLLKERNYTGDALVSYRLLIESVARLFIDYNKAAVSDEQLEKDIDDLIKFEKSLHMAKQDSDSIGMSDDEDMFDGKDLESFIKWWNKRTESEKDPRAKIDWNEIFQRLFDIANLEVDYDSMIHPDELHYFVSLPKLLKSTDKRTIVNYIHWKFIGGVLKYTSDEMRDIFFQFMKDEYGIEKRPPRWRECVREMEMSSAASFMFVDKYYHKKTAKAASKMMRNIRESLIAQIKNSNWLSSASKEALRKKLNAMKTLVGFPDWYENRTAVINHYKGLTIGYDYLDNILGFRRFSKKSEIRKFAGLEDDSGWIINPITINAVYSLHTNTLNVPAVAFQSPLFGTNVPNYVNYGVAGVIIGHEMGHGFDPRGIQFDGQNHQKLLEPDMLQIYLQRAECFIEQFDNYFEGRSIDSTAEQPAIEFDNNEVSKESKGAITIGENIADSNGLQSVVNAYKNMRNEEHPNGELKLPGFEEFSDEQMFFISFAETWCEVTTPKFDEKRMAEDEHSPPKFRVMGSVSNTREFARIFNCPSGSPMNPSNKCEIWGEPKASPKLKSRKYSSHDFGIITW